MRYTSFMQLFASDMMGLPIMHMSIFDKDNVGDTARWRLVFLYDTGKVYSSDYDTQRAFSYWTV
jgi:hypothetical protein